MLSRRVQSIFDGGTVFEPTVLSFASAATPLFMTELKLNPMQCHFAWLIGSFLFCSFVFVHI